MKRPGMEGRCRSGTQDNAVYMIGCIYSRAHLFTFESVTEPFSRQSYGCSNGFQTFIQSIAHFGCATLCIRVSNAAEDDKFEKQARGS